jgi:amino acid transporter
MGISSSIIVVLPLVYAAAENATWLAFVIAMAVYVLMAIQVNHFACRIATSGSIYTFVADSDGSGQGFRFISGHLFRYVSLSW